MHNTPDIPNDTVQSFVDAIELYKVSARRIAKISHNMLSARTINRVVHRHKNNEKHVLSAATIRYLDCVIVVLYTAKARNIITPSNNPKDSLIRRTQDVQLHALWKQLYPHN